jgi:hypothetical protein
MLTTIQVSWRTWGHARERIPTMGRKLYEGKGPLLIVSVVIVER